MSLISLAEDSDMASRESGKVNLDALIVRQDMDEGEPQRIPKEFSFGHGELVCESGLTYSVLRKPDFQRSTSSWTPEKVRDMVVAYLEGETVPSVIVWRSAKSNLFVIDGGHRLGSIIAWINDDYGDGKISTDHYGEKQNASAAKKTRDLIETSVGSYKDLREALNKPDALQKHKDNARKLVFASLKVQELEKESDAATAERAFIKINQQGVVLSETEKWLIHARYCPNAIAARAISLKGTGGAYWHRFESVENKKKISELGASIFNLLFTPDLDAGELKTDDVPIAGSYTASNVLGLIFQFVNFANGVPTKPPTSRADAETTVGIDVDGARTVEFLKRAKTAATLMTNLRKTDFARSADLHPFVYFYSRQGNHQPTLFLAVTYWLNDLDKRKKLPELAANGVRARLEDFLLEKSFFVPFITRKARGETKAVRELKRYLDFLFEKLSSNTSAEELLKLVGEEFSVATTAEPEDREATAPGSRISVQVKTALFIARELETAQRCDICNARVPARGVSSDHRKDRKHGGDGTKANVGPTHHACNSGKDKIKTLERKAAKSTT
jgi:hypothetical protein